jgi:hypothetical protein
MSMVKAPTEKIMLAEEANCSEASAQQSSKPNGTASTSGWEWPIFLASSRSLPAITLPTDLIWFWPIKGYTKT